MKKLLFLCAACLLALAGCTDREAESPTPTVAVSVSPAATPLAVETPAPTVSAPILEETVAPTETLPPVTESLPVETDAAVAQGWNGKADSLTLSDFPTQLSSADELPIAGAELPVDRASLFLIAQLPDSDTWLYGAYGPLEAQSLILRVGTEWRQFDIPYFTPRGNLPVMAYGDFDGDLELELAILPYQGSGTGVSVWGLHVVDFGADGAWSVLEFTPSDYEAILDQAVACTYAPETNVATLTAGDSTMEINLTDLGLSDPGEPINAYTGHIVYFTVENDAIFGHFVVGLSIPNLANGVLSSALLSADVVYTGSAFGLNNLSLSPPEF